MAVSGTGGPEPDVKSVPKSTDNMDPKSPFVTALSSMPVASGIKTHSIIAVRNPKTRRRSGMTVWFHTKVPTLTV